MEDPENLFVRWRLLFRYTSLETTRSECLTVALLFTVPMFLYIPYSNVL